MEWYMKKSVNGTKHCGRKREKKKIRRIKVKDREEYG
jgi:hypothetical protein